LAAEDGGDEVELQQADEQPVQRPAMTSSNAILSIIPASFNVKMPCEVSISVSCAN
jgi:hypothetical protein